MYRLLSVVGQILVIIGAYYRGYWSFLPLIIGVAILTQIAAKADETNPR